MTIYEWDNKVSLISPMEDITLFKLGDLLGFNQGTVISKSEVLSHKQVNLLNGLRYVNVHCDMVDRQRSLNNGVRSSVMCSLPIDETNSKKGRGQSFWDMESKVFINKRCV